MVKAELQPDVPPPACNVVEGRDCSSVFQPFGTTLTPFLGFRFLRGT